MSERQPMLVQCRGCGHVWPLVYLPMEILKAAEAMQRACCPGCAETKAVYIASEAQALKWHADNPTKEPA